MTTKSNLAVEQAQAAKRGAAAPVHLGYDEAHRASLTPFRTLLPSARAALQDITSAVAAACAATNNGTVNAKPPPQVSTTESNVSCVPVRPASSAPPHQVRPTQARPISNAPPPQWSSTPKRPLVVDDGDDALFAALDVDALCNNAAVLKNGASHTPVARGGAVVDNDDDDDDVFANIDIDRVAREYQSNKRAATAVLNAPPPPLPVRANFVAPVSAPSNSTASTSSTAAAPFTRRAYYATLSLERLTEMRNKMSQLVDDLIMSNVATRDESAEYVAVCSRIF